MRALSNKCGLIWLAVNATAAVGLAQTGAVTGKVTNSATGAPILHAHVSAHPWSGASRQSYGALTDAGGEFAVSLPAGQYSISAEAAGFQTPPIVPEFRTDRLVIQAGENRNDIEFKLVPFGAISGRILDSGGRPLQGIEVSALGRNGFLPPEVTDPDGRFRIGALPPDKYALRAVPHSYSMPPEIRSDGTSEVRYAPTYYSSALTPESAARLEVLPGAERNGIELRLLPLSIVAVRGLVSGVPAGINGLYLTVRKVEPPRAPDNHLRSGATPAAAGNRVKPDGSFELWGLSPGSYVLTAQGNGSGWTSAPVEIEVAGKDVEGVKIGLMQELDITGQVVAADGARIPRVPPNTPIGQTPQISLEDLNGQPHSFSVISADGSFHFTHVQPGRYRVRVTLFGAYVKSMRLGSTDIEGSIIDLRQGGSALMVTASPANGQITGVVRNPDGPVPNARVELLTEDQQLFENARNARADGRYAFTNLPPGKYRLLVLDPGVARAFAIATQLADYADIIETVELHPGERVTVDLRQHK